MVNYGLKSLRHIARQIRLYILLNLGTQLPLSNVQLTLKSWLSNVQLTLKSCLSNVQLTLKSRLPNYCACGSSRGYIHQVGHKD